MHNVLSSVLPYYYRIYATFYKDGHDVKAIAVYGDDCKKLYEIHTIVKDLVRITMCGYRYNRKYPPNEDKYGTHYRGYKNNAEEVLFYDFAVQFYDVSFKYDGKSYYLLTDEDHVAVCDEHFTEEYEIFSNANELIEQFKIDGKTLLSLIDQLEDVEPE